ncbi:fumarylacetoacetate hydrolase family protein [Belnapia rosea]|uniref:2-keto-4-pentenoate hydratase/2-oxohepta-3-ene-1,7-dioic acid hydratase (Catechol pathway) n=1 Tax=Belnapia rosea TaxID=938405 RepID=A0A1G6SXN0_9PROT|nr:fumarylacetoacetate hydrolase family protein [Belnapia rosea]SDD20957.1 2-keto-4-pentenoate hydratase/2-oxohepta-3-ene-1,7-dioic acid hydratase (catechol pathway) [Belnapia rosea]
MKLISFAIDGEARYGVLEGEAVIDLSDRLGARFPNLLSLIEADALAEAAAALSAPGPRHALAGLHYLEPIPGARRIFCVGANYPKVHPTGGVVSGPEFPAIFQKPAETLVPHGARLQAPTASRQFDYEGELAFVIGRGGANIPPERALSHIAGYTCLNDGSVRDFQKHSVWAGKNFVRSGGFGPWLVTADEIGDPATLTLVTRLNGEEVQRTGLDRMFFSIPAIIAYLSAVTPLLPGDVVATGSPEGSGATRTPPRWLVPGDRIEVEVSKVGVLENVVA